MSNDIAASYVYVLYSRRVITRLSLTQSFWIVFSHLIVTGSSNSSSSLGNCAAIVIRTNVLIKLENSGQASFVRKTDVEGIRQPFRNKIKSPFVYSISALLFSSNNKII